MSCAIYPCCPEGVRRVAPRRGMSLSGIPNNKADVSTEPSPKGCVSLSAYANNEADVSTVGPHRGTRVAEVV